MALPATTVYEVRTAGNDTNGGGFITGAAGVDYSQQDAKNTVGNNISTTDAVANGTTTLTSATASFTSDIVGNVIYLQGGTGSLVATRRQVTAFTNSTTITVEATVASGTGITMNIGGALASLGEAGRVNSSTQIVWIKAGTYTQTSTSNNVSAGAYTIQSEIYGYDAIRGDFNGTRPLLQADGTITGFNMIFLSAGPATIRGVNFDGNSRSSSRGIIATAGQIIIADCNFANFTNTAFTLTTGTVVINSNVTGCATTIPCNISAGMAFNVVAHDNTIGGFTIAATGRAIRCIADTCTGATSDGFTLTGAASVISCVSYNSGRDGYRFAVGSSAINSIAEDNTALGFNNQGNPNDVIWYNCAAFSNSTDFSLGTGKGVFNVNSVTGSGSFFTNAAGGDFSLNNTSGAGAAAREAGIPGVSPTGLTTGYLDIGYAQHQAGSTPGGGEHSSVF